ncbi:MAG TPA: fatty acid--CoA ligase family protein [Acidimicrobiales bacterium]|nr:fatty acid--CoA ligase family protein [Acidimicrobiales bacterium]
MHELVALEGPAGPAWVDALRRAWDDGDAVAPIDPRLPPAARDQLLDALAPTVVVHVDGARRRHPGGRPVEPGDALVVATSGTTGTPKGVVLTHDAVAASATATSRRLAVDPTRHRWLACLPLAHVGGLSVVTRALLTGTPLEVHPGFDAAAVTDAADRGATHVSLVATALARIDPTRFERIVLGGSAPPPDRPANAVATYGMTETGSGIVYDGFPLDGVEVRAVDGELHVRGPMLLRAYRDGTDPRTADGWLPTGDLGGVDAATGRVTVLGRRGDLIITGGENVWPTPVEAELERHPGVAEAAVIGRPDPEWGQRVVAVIVPADARRPPDLDELRRHVRAALPAWCAPRSLELVERLPRTALGKVVRTRL